MSQKHTPLPWRQDGSQFSGSAHTAYIVGGANGAHPTIFVSSTCKTPEEVEQFEANVDLILSIDKMQKAIIAAFKLSCARSETNRKWTMKDQHVHEQLATLVERMEQSGV